MIIMDYYPYRFGNGHDSAVQKGGNEKNKRI